MKAEVAAVDVIVGLVVDIVVVWIVDAAEAAEVLLRQQNQELVLL